MSIPKMISLMLQLLSVSRVFVRRIGLYSQPISYIVIELCKASGLM